MKILLAELNSVVFQLENSEFSKEAQELHEVFIKVAELEKEAGLKDIGKAAIPALALMGNAGNVASDFKPVENPAIAVQQKEDVEDPIEKDSEELIQEEQKSSGNISNRLKKFLEVFEWNEIQRLLTKKGITKKIATRYCGYLSCHLKPWSFLWLLIFKPNGFKLLKVFCQQLHSRSKR